MGKDKLVRWRSIAPIDERYNDRAAAVSEPFELGNGVFIGPAPKCLQDESIIEMFSFGHQEWARGARSAIWIEYEADSLGNPAPDPHWKGAKPRSNEDWNRERIQLANLALWLAKPSGLALEPLVHVQHTDEAWTLRHSSEVLRVWPDARSAHAHLTALDLENARSLNLTVASLERKGPVWVAIRTLFKALAEGQDWEIRYLLTWICLEALFGPDDARETTYRISERIAFFLASDKAEAKEFFGAARAGYSWRSKAVHGMRLEKLRKARDAETRSIELLRQLEKFVRGSLTKILNSDELTKAFCGKDREIYLDGLVFSDPVTRIYRAHRDLFDRADCLRQFSKARLQEGKGPPIKTAEDAVVALFVVRAHTTFAAGITLCRNGFAVDAAMQARSLVEGIITLRYILLHPGMAERYAEFDHVAKKHTLDMVRGLGKRFADLRARWLAAETEIEANYGKFQNNYAGDFDKYKWAGASMSLLKLAQCSGCEELYKLLYGSASEVLHVAAGASKYYMAVDGDNPVTFFPGPNERLLEENTRLLLAVFPLFWDELSIKCDEPSWKELRDAASNEWFEYFSRRSDDGRED